MATWLRQSTSVDVPIGPFLDNVDGFTAETGLTITQPDIRLKKNAAAWAQKAAAQTLTHEENGWYEVTLDATDTNTLGILVVAVHESGALPVWREFLVVPAQVWDSYLSTDLLQVDTREVGGTVQTAGDIMADTNDIQTRLPAALVSGRIDASVGAMAAGVVTAAAVATDAIDADAIAANAIGASELAADAVTEIQSGLATGAALATVQSDTDDIQTRLPAALVTGRMDSSVGAMAADVVTAAAIAADAIGASELAAGAVDEILDDLLSDSIPADGSLPTVRQALYMLVQFMLERSVSGTTVTVKKADGTTSLFTLTLDSATSPTSITRAT